MAQNRYIAEIYIEEEELEQVAPVIVKNFNEVEFDKSFYEEQKSMLISSVESANSDSINIASRAIAKVTNDHEKGIYSASFRLTAEELKKSEFEDLENWYNNLFSHGGIKIGVAGKADPKKIAPFIDQLLINFDPKKSELPQMSIERNFPNKLMFVENPAASQSTMLFSRGLPPVKSEAEEWALLYLINALTQGENSRLFQKLRQELRASYGVDSGFDASFPDYSTIEIFTQVDPNAQKEAYQILVSELENIKNNGLTQAEFEQIQSTFQKNIEEAREDEYFLAYLLMQQQLSP